MSLMRRYRDLGEIDPGRVKMQDGKEWVPGTTLVFDVDELEDVPATATRRGRPRGTQAALVADHRPVTADDMRFLSAFCQGVDPRQAARTYLANNLHNDGRSAQGYARQLLARLANRANEHPERSTAVQLVAELQRRLTTAMRRAPVIDVAHMPPGQSAIAPTAAPGAKAVMAVGANNLVATAVPSLEDFAARFDDGVYSEAELIELYEEEFGSAGLHASAAAHGPGGTSDPRGASLTNTPAVAAIASHKLVETDAPSLLPVDRRLEILEWLAPRLALDVTPDSSLTAWLEPELAREMQEGHGLKTLAELATWINKRGSRFYAGVPGLGRQRALRLLAWLAERENLTGVALRSSLRALVADGRPDSAGVRARSGDGEHTTSGLPAVAGEGRALVPLEQLDWPVELAGAVGELRSREPVLLKIDGAPVRDDREALHCWLCNVEAGKSRATVRAYRGAIERFVLWALLERKKPLSSMSLDDLVAFREFLYQPPAHWCSTARVLRACDEWRPLRGPLAEKAVRQVLDVVKLLYGFWHDEAYLRANPARALKAASSDPSVRQRAERKPTIGVARTFTREDLQAMQRELADMREGPAKRRLQAILSLFLDSGVRRAEVEKLTLGQAVPVGDDGKCLSEMRDVSMLGKTKGERVREVPMLASTLAYLELHYEDRLGLIKVGALPTHFGDIARDHTPVLSVLRMQAGGARNRRGLTPASAPRVPSFDGRLDNKTLYGILKAFFKKVGQRSDLVHGHADFDRASTHWLRHTFALQFLADKPGDLPAVQDLLGHRAGGVIKKERFF